MRVCELREKEVINTCDCKIIGNVSDIDFDINTGVIKALIVPGPCKLFGITGREIEYIIPYRCVNQIGSDIILVSVDLKEVTKKVV